MSRSQIHMVHGTDTLQCASYLIDGPEGTVLVDPGSGTFQEEVIAGIEDMGCGLRRIRGILLTHCHVDHALAAYRFRSENAPLLSSPFTAEILERGGHEVWYEHPECVVATTVDRTLADGETIELAGISIRAIHTPGHTPASVSYLVETMGGLAALTGDLVDDRGHPGWAGSEGFSVDDSVRSIERLIEEAPDRALWGHGRIDRPALEWLEASLKLATLGQWEIKTELHPDELPP